MAAAGRPLPCHSLCRARCAPLRSHNGCSMSFYIWSTNLSTAMHDCGEEAGGVASSRNGSLEPAGRQGMSAPAPQAWVRTRGAARGPRHAVPAVLRCDECGAKRVARIVGVRLALSTVTPPPFPLPFELCPCTIKRQNRRWPRSSRTNWNRSRKTVSHFVRVCEREGTRQHPSEMLEGERGSQDAAPAPLAPSAAAPAWRPEDAPDHAYAIMLVRATDRCIRSGRAVSTASVVVASLCQGHGAT